MNRMWVLLGVAALAGVACLGVGCDNKEHILPDAGFTADPRNGEGTLNVQFTDQSVRGSDVITGWQWDFGDGGGSTEQNPSHLYAQPGMYSVTLTVGTSEGSDTERKEAYISVVAPGGTVTREPLVVVDQNPYLVLQSLTDSQMTFQFTGTGQMPLQSGDILTGSAGEGYLRRATSVSVQGESVVVETENVSMTEVYENASIRTTTQFSDEDFAQVGIPATKGAYARLSLNKTLYQSSAATATLAGQIEFVPTVEFDLDINPSGVEYLRLAATGTLNINADLTLESRQSAGINVDYSLFGDILQVAKPKKTVYNLTPPFWITTELDIRVGLTADATAAATLQAGFDSARVLTVGTEYTGGQWSNISNTDVSATRHGPVVTLEAGCGVRLYLAPVLSTRIYSITGPALSVEPYLAFTQSILPPPPAASLGVGIDGSLAFDLVRLRIFSWGFALGYEHHWQGPYYPLWTYTPPPAPAVSSFSVNGGASSTTTRNVTLNNICTGSPVEYRASESSGFTGAAWLPYSAAPSFTLSSGSGTKTVYFQVRNSAGTSTASSDTITLNESTVTAPSVSSFSINGGASSTTTRNVTLNNICTGSPVEYRASESSGFTGAAWLPYSSAPSFTLSSGNGTKTVYFQVRNSAGTSTASSDTITLNESTVTAPAVSSFSINGGASSTTTRNVTLNNVCTGSPVEYRASESFGFTGAVWLPYSAAPTFTLSSGNVTKTVYFQVRNSAGTPAAVSDTITLNESTGGDTVTILLPGNVPLELVRIPAGSFQMGSPDTERGRYSCEGPAHTVTIGYDFYMGKYEVTQGQWLAVMGTSPGGSPWRFGSGSDYPAYSVSWEDAQAFITVLNTHITATGQGPATLRLPSEAEWEYACRGGTQTRFYFGDSLGVEDGPDCEDDGIRSQYMWYCGNNADYGEPGFGSKPVGGLLPNGFGLHDMSGNVWEWCEDWWHSDYTGAPTDGSAWVSPTDSCRVCRGGDWFIYAQLCRSAWRTADLPSLRNDIGFRLASLR